MSFIFRDYLFLDLIGAFLLLLHLGLHLLDVVEHARVEFLFVQGAQLHLVFLHHLLVWVDLFRQALEVFGGDPLLGVLDLDVLVVLGLPAVDILVPDLHGGHSLGQAAEGLCETEHLVE